MMLKCCTAAFAAAFVFLAGCTSGDVILDRPGAGYVEDVRAHVAAVDWSGVQTVEVSLAEFAFAPETLAFERGRPYRLVLENGGRRTHTFVSEGFFKAIAVQKLASADGEIANPYIESIELARGAVKEITFVPVRPGSYDLRCTVFLHERFGMHGRITIE